MIPNRLIRREMQKKNFLLIFAELDIALKHLRSKFLSNAKTKNFFFKKKVGLI